MKGKTMKSNAIAMSCLCLICMIGAASAFVSLPVHQAVSVASVTDIGIADEDLDTADLAALTAGMTSLEKVQFSYEYTHCAANRQGSLIRLYTAGTVGHMGYEITIPPATVTAIQAEVNALADRMVLAQSYVANLTD